MPESGTERKRLLSKFKYWDFFLSRLATYAGAIMPGSAILAIFPDQSRAAISRFLSKFGAFGDQLLGRHQKLQGDMVTSKLQGFRCPQQHVRSRW